MIASRECSMGIVNKLFGLELIITVPAHEIGISY